MGNPSTAAVFLSRSPEDSDLLARALAAWAQGGDVIALEGELGTGKTVIARAMAAALGVGGPVTSPTFGLIMEYQAASGGRFHHLDLYRITGSEQALAFGIEEYLFDRQAITVVEWPERIADLLSAKDAGIGGRLLYVKLEHVSANRRRIILPAAFGTQILAVIDRLRGSE